MVSHQKVIDESQLAGHIDSLRLPPGEKEALVKTCNVFRVGHLVDYFRWLPKELGGPIQGEGWVVGFNNARKFSIEFEGMDGTMREKRFSIPLVLSAYENQKGDDRVVYDISHDGVVRIGVQGQDPRVCLKPKTIILPANRGTLAWPDRNWSFTD